MCNTFLLTWVLLISIASQAQDVLSAKTIIPAAKLQQDVSILRSSLEQLHPGLYRYNSRKQMDVAFDDLARDFRHDQALEQVYLRLALFTAQIRCGHTFLNPLNQTKDVSRALFGRAGKLPFEYRWIDKHMVVTRDSTPDHSLSRGTDVLSINGVPSAKILTWLMQVANSDGGNDAKRIALSEETGDHAYENPDIFLPIFLRDSGTLHLRIRRYHEHHVSQLSVAKQQAEVPPQTIQTAQEAQALFTLTYLPDGVALLRMPSWVMYHSKWDWKAWLNTSIDQVIERRSGALIVDIRGNTGGDDVGSVLLSRLPSTPIPNDSARLVRYRRVPQELLPYLSTWDKRFKDWGSSAVDLAVPWPTAPSVPYYLQVEQTAAPTRAESSVEKFTGKVYVLTDASNSSATFGFAQTIQQQQLGKLVGEPTGGNGRGINGGAFFFLTLPNSHLEIDLPLIGYFPRTAQIDGGLEPDIPIDTTIRSIAVGEDPILHAPIVWK